MDGWDSSDGAGPATTPTADLDQDRRPQLLGLCPQHDDHGLRAVGHLRLETPTDAAERHALLRTIGYKL